jgi:hypothetical protein
MNDYWDKLFDILLNLLGLWVFFDLGRNWDEVKGGWGWAIKNVKARIRACRARVHVNKLGETQ